MIFPNQQTWLRTAAVLCAVALLSAPVQVSAAGDGVLLIRPHCENEGNPADETIFGPIPDVEGMVTLGDGTCRKFDIEDPQTLRTPELEVGDILDIDVYVQNPTSQPISRARTWLSYDPNVLEGVSIDIHPNFPVATPGESDFDQQNGYAMIEGTNEDSNANQKNTVVIARVQFRVKVAPPAGTIISFYDVQRGGHTDVINSSTGTEETALVAEPGSLHVVFAGSSTNTQAIPPPPDTTGANQQITTQQTNTFAQTPFEQQLFGQAEQQAAQQAQQTAGLVPDGGACTVSTDCQSGMCSAGVCTSSLAAQQQPATTATDTTGGADSAAAQRTAFSLLQVRNVRVTTEGSSLYVGWDALNSQQLKAYNVYYGTTTGRYIQRKTVSGTMRSVVIRALPVGTTYYVAVRAVSSNDEESAFSQEVAVEIGNPESSTSPLVPGQDVFVDVGPDGENPIKGDLGGGDATIVPGETGVGTSVAIFLVLSAIIGTLIASRRQVIVASQK